MKTTISFLDKNGHRADVEAEITERNGYPEFRASGRYLGSFGQCLGSIVPATEAQKELIDLWTKYHLKDVSSVGAFEGHLLDTITAIEAEESEAMEKKELKTGDELILEQMSEYGIDEDMLDACKAYYEATSATDLSDFDESYTGEFSSDEDFAQDMHDQIWDKGDAPVWPFTCINWTLAARELMYDYSEANGYYFRNL